MNSKRESTLPGRGWGRQFQRAFNQIKLFPLLAEMFRWLKISATNYKQQNVHQAEKSSFAIYCG